MSDKGYSRITIKVRDEWKFREKIKEAADACGESVNGFMIRVIRDAVKKQGIQFPVGVFEEKSE